MKFGAQLFTMYEFQIKSLKIWHIDTLLFMSSAKIWNVNFIRKNTILDVDYFWKRNIQILS